MKADDAASHDLMTHLLDAIPFYLFLVDEDLRIVLYNKAAASLVGEVRTQVLRRRTGEVLHCLNADNSLGGCGRSKACRTCIIRGAMHDAFETNLPVTRRSNLERGENGKEQDVFMQVTASPFPYQNQRLVLLVLEDISPEVKLQRLIPICSKCRKVRSDTDYWTQLEEYARDRLGADFTHGYCPDCLREEIEAVEKRKKK